MDKKSYMLALNTSFIGSPIYVEGCERIVDVDDCGQAGIRLSVNVGPLLVSIFTEGTSFRLNTARDLFSEATFSLAEYETVSEVARILMQRATQTYRQTR